MGSGLPFTPQEPFQLALEGLVCLVGRLTLDIRLSQGRAEAFRRSTRLMPLQRVRPREEIPAVFAEMDVKRVRLREVAVALIVLPVCECGIGAKPALERVDSPARPVIRRRPKEVPMPLAEFPRDFEAPVLPLPVLRAEYSVLLLHHAARVVLCQFRFAPLNPGQLSLRSGPHQLLDTRSR